MTIPHYVNEDQSDIRAIKPGWYAVERNGKLSSGLLAKVGASFLSNKTQNRSLQGCCSGRASRCVLRKWWSTWRRVRTCSFSLRGWAARMSSTIMSKSTARKKSGSSDLGHMLVLEATRGQAVLQG